MAASWYKRRHRYIVNQRVKLNLKIILPTIIIALAKLAIDSANNRHARNKSCDFHSKSGGLEIFIKLYYVKKSGDLPPNREAWKLCSKRLMCVAIIIHHGVSRTLANEDVSLQYM